MAVRGDLRQRRAALEREWAHRIPELKRARPGPHDGAELRTEVIDSWTRSLSTVDPGRSSAPATDGGELRPRWADSPLRRPVGDLADELRGIADDAGFIAAVTDRTGTILWTCGGRVMRRRAEQVNFAPGGRWSEDAMGTNALSLALSTGRPSVVFSAEHLVAALHGWTCYCAPVHGPDGRMLGVLDLSTTWDRSHPLALSTVRGLVSAIEARLRAEPPADLGNGPPHSASPAVRLTCLGEGHAVHAGVALRLPPRQLEILALLALEPEGYAPERLRDALYGERAVTASTFKAEVSHLRRALGGSVAPRRYALTVPVNCDAVEVLRALAHGDLDTALTLYRGPLLPYSEAPGIAAWREHLTVAVRSAVLATTRPEPALRYGERAPHDVEIHRHALRLLPPGDTRRALATGRLSAVLRD
ncbi:GAF domain-containing protein [Streptomyces sp. TR06-5]|uniref:GAF domain-containing protein n=1 Tax=unclassified Streptomyces TaxID=2593676 RepID=UPI0039A083C1